MQVVLHDWYSSHLLHASDAVIWNCVTLTLEATKSTQVEIQQKSAENGPPPPTYFSFQLGTLGIYSVFNLVH